MRSTTRRSFAPLRPLSAADDTAGASETSPTRKQNDADRLAKARRLVVKVGSTLVTSNGSGLDLSAINNGHADATLRAQGRKSYSHRVPLPAGCNDWDGRNVRTPSTKLQAAAAVGQMGLAQVHERAFAAHSLATAQVLPDAR